MDRFNRSSIVLFLFVSSLCAAQGVPCSEASLTYYSPTPDRAKHLHITSHVTSTFDPNKKVLSELVSNRWLVTVEPDYMKNPPWNTTVFIGDRDKDKPFLQISITDHGTSLNVRWVTDRLLLINVWWGRFGMSDWLIDVDRNKIVYDELLNYYELYSCTNDSKKTSR